MANNLVNGERLQYFKDKFQEQLLLVIYPVGCIYMSATNVNPGTLFGGTWVAWGSGRVPVGVNSDDTTFSEAENTGGSKTVTISVSNLPSHTHTIPAHSHGLNNHTHTVPAHTHTIAHTHSVPAHTGKADLQGSHAHKGWYLSSVRGTSGGSLLCSSNGGTSVPSVTSGDVTDSRGGHQHTVSIAALTTDASSAANTGNSSQLTSGGNSGNTANSSTLTSGGTGSDSALSVLQPYITCYMWKRTA